MFKLEIRTDGAAFRSDTETDKHGNYVLDSEAVEVRRLLRQVEMKLSRGYTDGELMDVNGNKVGEWFLE